MDYWAYYLAFYTVYSKIINTMEYKDKYFEVYYVFDSFG